MPENNTYKPNWIKDALLLILCILMGAAFSGLISFVLNSLGIQSIGISVDKITREGAFTHLHLSLLLSHLGTFIIPALVFLYFKRRVDDNYYTPRTDYQGFFPLLVSVIIIITSVALVQYTYMWNKSLELPHWMVELEVQQEAIIEAILSKDTVSALMVNLAIIALLPSIGEELIFRSIVQGIAYRATRRPWLAILISAVIFSAFHMMFQGFVPRFILGVLLGFMFWISNNLWLPFLAHFFNNGIQVIAYYLFKKGLIETDITAQSTINWPWALLSLMLTILFCHLLLLFFGRRKQISWSDFFNKTSEEPKPN